MVDEKLVDFLARLSWKRTKTLADRNRRRQQDGNLWFTVEEYKIIDVLASLIVPSEEDSPGAKEAGAVQRIDQWVVGSPERQAVYARGLLALDERSQRDHGFTFDQLTHEQQLGLLRHIDQLHSEWSRSTSKINKIKNRLLVRYYKVNGFFWAVELFRRVVPDVFRAFYSSRVCWDWLGYDGPPMPHGYSDLLEMRLPTPQTQVERQNSMGSRPPVGGESDHMLAQIEIENK